MPALILAAFSPEPNLGYFRSRMAQEELAEGEWLVCGNLLARHGAPGFAASCLDALAWSVTVTVRDAGRPPRGATG